MGKTKVKMTPCQLYKAKKISRAEYDKRIGSKRASGKPGYTKGKVGRGSTRERNQLRADLRGLKLELAQQRKSVQDMERILGKKF